MANNGFARHGLMLATLAAMTAGTALGATLLSEDFEDSDYQGWTVLGQQMIFPGGNPGNYMGVPLTDLWGVELRNEDATTPLLGDLTRHGGPLQVAADVRVFTLNNFFGGPVPPGAFPLVLEFVDYGDPDDFTDNASVYTIGAGLPAIEDGWQRMQFDVPDPTMTDLPAGWGGTGAEDPNTFEPILPAGRTYRSVLESVDEVRLTTFQPGYFYTSNFWEMGFDNVWAGVVPEPTSALLALVALAALRRR